MTFLLRSSWSSSFGSDQATGWTVHDSNPGFLSSPNRQETALGFNLPIIK